MPADRHRFRNQRRQHRGAGGHFDDLQIGAILVGHRLDQRADFARDLVALPIALLFRRQVDLHVAVVRRAAQVVLAH